MGLNRWLTARAVATCAWGLLVAFPGTLQAQGVVRSAALTVDLTAGDGGAAVRLEYEMTLEDVAEAVTVELLVPEGIAVGDVFATGRERVVLWPASGVRRSAAVAVERSAGNERRLVVEYRVDGAVREEGGAVHVRIPVLSVSLPPTESGDVLQASVRVPAAWSVSERFPTGLREAEQGVYEASLPVVPSVVSLRGRTDGKWRPGLGLILEVLTAVILVGFGTASWRNLAGVTR